MAKARSKAGTFTEKQHVSYVAVYVYVEPSTYCSKD